jgi:uncharacterized protein (TIGR02118 family)
MINLSVLYHFPEDSNDYDAFLQYYENVHIPIAQRVPMDALSWGRCIPGPNGEKPRYIVVAQLQWSTAEAMAAANMSPAGQAAYADQANFSNGYDIVMTEGESVSVTSAGPG